jgi:hypothetical protein
MRVKVNNQRTKTVTVNSQGTTEVVSVGVQGPPGPNQITTAGDVDVSNLKDGSMLVYSTAISKWEATTSLLKQELEGGQF